MKNKKRGSILVASIFMAFLIAMGTLLMVRTTIDHQRLNLRRYDLSRAFYAAESGVHQVVHWGNYGNEYPGGIFQYTPQQIEIGGDFIVVQDGKLQNQYPNLYAALSSGPLVIEKSDLESLGLGTLNSKYDYDVSYIERIELSLPDKDDPPIPNMAFKINSTGQSIRGVERRVVAYIVLPSNINIKLLAALVSLNSAAVGGNAKVHWGEAWSKGNITGLPSPNNMSHLDETNSNWDQWARYRTQGIINFPSSWKMGTNPANKDIYNGTSPTPNSNWPGFFPPINVQDIDFGESGIQNSSDGKYTYGFEQNAGNLPFPDFIHQDRSTMDYANYNQFKDFAQDNGSYYTTDASGNIYKNGTQVNFDTEFPITNRDDSPYDLVFIDTIDGNPPNGSNMATIQISGNTSGLKGIFYICANINETGQGNPSSLTAENPNGDSEVIDKVWLDGVLFSAGLIDFGGNPVVYGCVVAENGFSGNGTPDIYYNHKLKDGLQIENGNVGSIMRIAQQKNY